MSITSFSVTPRRLAIWDLVRLEIAFAERVDRALRLAQVEEQLLLVRGRAHLHERPRAQDVFLNGGLDPPHCVGGEAEAFVRLEPLHRLHQADIAFRDDLGNRQAIAAVPHRDLRDEPQMAGDELVRRVAVAVLAPRLGQHVLLLRLQHREPPDLFEIPRQTAFGGNHRHSRRTGHVLRPPYLQAPGDRQAYAPPPSTGRRNMLRCNIPHSQHRGPGLRKIVTFLSPRREQADRRSRPSRWFTLPFCRYERR
jgi:hypothetical protein